LINVTKTFLPNIEEYQTYLVRIWNNQWLSNRGELVLELEENLKKYLSISDITLMNNGTIPLQIALKNFGCSGEIITTPFSYVATTAAIVWENCTPVFVDINPDYLTIDETKIESAITEKTTCILATHVFGNPCNIELIEIIAKKHNLKVIYDAAHAFGVKYKNVSIFNFGDVSTCSFHATKLFHTGEGGALICNIESYKEQLYYSHNFGHNGPLDFFGLGINGKISELQAAMGLSILPYMESIINSRKYISEFYDANLDFSKLRKILIREGTQWNYSYYPVICKSENHLIILQSKLNQKQIFPRRYFCPSLNNLPYVDKTIMPISEDIASRILCLPLYVGLKHDELNLITKIINQNID
jgi:dTDP-4-amino-4,6-dideoxygalactose transaminase